MNSTTARTQSYASAPAAHGSSPDDVDLRRVAVRRLKRKRAFRYHLFVYLTVNTLFWSGWIIGGLVDQWVFPWPVFPTVFWGLFVLGWWRDIYGRNSIGEQHIQREIEQLRDASSSQADRSHNRH